MSVARERVEFLREEIARHNEAYYTHDAPTIPDADYDALLVELRGLEGDYPELASDASVTHQVGAGSTTVFSEVSHAEPMLSLDNVFDVDELTAWAERAARGLGADASALAFAVEGKVKADIELQPLSAINDVFARLKRGDVASRVVLDFASR